jgi:hypothetical protein
MMNFSSLLTIAQLIVLANLSGCITTGKQFPADPSEQVGWYLDRAKGQALDQNNYERVGFMLVEAATRPNGVTKAKQWLIDNPSIKTRLYSYFKLSSGEKITKQEASDTVTYIAKLSEFGIVENGYELLSAFNAELSRRNASNEMNWLLSDDIANLIGLQSKEAKAIMFGRSLAELYKPNHNQTLSKSVADYVSAGLASSEDIAAIKSLLDRAPLKRAELEAVKSIFPEVVNAKLDNLTRQIKLTYLPIDRLTEEDLKTLLAQKSEYFVITTEGSRHDNKIIEVVIEKLRYEERVIAPQIQTITYPQHEVYTLMAVMFMPRNASYVYEQKTEATNIEYGYSIKIIHKGVTISDEVLRGVLSETYTSCQNQRIVNVFGGTSKADFIANDAMKSNCSGSNTMPTPVDFRKRIEGLIVEKIVASKTVGWEL